MKKIVLAISVLSLSVAQANISAYCTTKVESLVKKVSETSFSTLKVDKVRSKAEAYVGHHVKKYSVRVSYTNSADVNNYELNVFEFETPGTECEIDSLKRTF